MLFKVLVIREPSDLEQIPKLFPRFDKVILVNYGDTDLHNEVMNRTNLTNYDVMYILRAIQNGLSEIDIASSFCERNGYEVLSIKKESGVIQCEPKKLP